MNMRFFTTTIVPVVAVSALVAVCSGYSFAQSAADRPPPYPVADPGPIGAEGQGGPPAQSSPPGPPQPYGAPAPPPPQGQQPGYPAPADAPPGTYQNPYPPPGAYRGPYPPPPPAYGTAPGTVYVPGETPCWTGPFWTVRIEELVLQRSTTRNQPLFLDAGGQPLLNSQTSLNFPMEVGLGLDAICHLPSSWEFEFGYFGLDSWLARNAAPDGSSMVIDNSGQTADGTGALLRYKSSIYLFEVNLRRPISDKVTLLAGFSAGELDDYYTAYGSFADVEYKSVNGLYGFQIGADWTAFNTGPLRINAICKAGVYGNSIHQRSYFDTATVDGALGEKTGHVAFLGQIGLAATYEFTPRFAARAYYQAVWLDGVALAPEQIGTTDFAAKTMTVDTGGSLFYHGGGIGLEFKF